MLSPTSFLTLFVFEIVIVFTLIYISIKVFTIYRISSLFSSQGTLVGTSGLEPPTSRLSGVRSNHLSYAPIIGYRLIFSLYPLPSKLSNISTP